MKVAPHAAIGGTVAYVVAVVLTPREAWWAFGVQAAVLAVCAVLARVDLRGAAPRLLVEVPFVVFALLLPLVAAGPRVSVGPLSLSESGLWSAWNVLVKGTLGVGASIVLGSLVSPAELLRGFRRLGVPAFVIVIGTFALRYTSVVRGDLARMQVARVSRCDDPRSLRQARAVAATAGTLFVRTYERGERIHQAMLARGWDGTLPDPAPPTASPGAWAAALAPGACAAAAALASIVASFVTGSAAP